MYAFRVPFPPHRVEPQFVRRQDLKHNLIANSPITAVGRQDVPTISHVTSATSGVNENFYGHSYYFPLSPLGVSTLELL